MSLFEIRFPALPDAIKNFNAIQVKTPRDKNTDNISVKELARVSVSFEATSKWKNIHVSLILEELFIRNPWWSLKKGPSVARANGALLCGGWFTSTSHMIGPAHTGALKTRAVANSLLRN